MSSVRLARKETHHVFASVCPLPEVSKRSVAGRIITPSNFAISSHLASGGLRRWIDRHRGLDCLSRIRAVSIGVLGAERPEAGRRAQHRPGGSDGRVVDRKALRRREPVSGNDPVLLVLAVRFVREPDRPIRSGLTVIKRAAPLPPPPAEIADSERSFIDWRVEIGCRNCGHLQHASG